MKQKLVLFTPGPVMTSANLKRGLSHPDIPHRRLEFEKIFARTRQNLLKLYKADQEYAVAIVTGSGTSSNETALSSIIRDEDEVLLIKNGVFGDRLDDILTCYYPKNIHRMENTWGQQPDLEKVELTLRDNQNISWICIVFHETSTGMVNPVRKIGDIVNRYRRHLFVDCISAIGAEDIDVVRDHIDACTGSANKAISGPTGISFVCIKRAIIPSLGIDIPLRNIYLNLHKHLEYADKFNQTPNTPAVTNFIGLDIALQELFEEGLNSRIDRYQECARIIRSESGALGLSILVPEGYRSNTVTSVFLPEGVSLPEFIDEMERRGFVLYPGKGIFEEQRMFQICNMGWISPKDCKKLMIVINEVIDFLTHGST